MILASINSARASSVRRAVGALASPRTMESGLRAITPQVHRRLDMMVKKSTSRGDPRKMFSAVVRSYSMANIVAKDVGVGAPQGFGNFEGFGGFDGDFGFSLNPVSWVTDAAGAIASVASSVASAVASGIEAAGGAIVDAAKFVAEGSIKAWNAAKDALVSLNPLTAAGRRRLFNILITIFIPPPLPLHYMMKRFPDLIDCFASSHGIDRLVCFGKWLVDSIKDLLSDPVFWIVLNMLIGNVAGAAVLGISMVANVIADTIKDTNAFGSSSRYVAAFIRIIVASGDLLFVWRMGPQAFLSPATYFILGATLMQGEQDVRELGTIGQGMAENATLISTLFRSANDAANKLSEMIRFNPSPERFDVLKLVGSVFGGIGSVFSSIGHGLSKIPLLGGLLAGGFSALGDRLKSLPDLIQQLLRMAGTAAVATAKAAGTVTQATVDAAVAAARAAADADYKKALDSALRASADAAAAAAKGAADASAKALAVAQQGAKDAIDELTKQRQINLDLAMKVKSLSLPPIGWPKNLPWPPPKWPPDSDNEVVPPPPPVPRAVKIATAQPVSAATPTASGGSVWHLVLGAAVGFVTGGPPGAVAGGVAAHALLGRATA